MTMDDVMMIIILGGFALCGGYFRAQYKDWRKQHIAETQRKLRVRLLYMADTRRPSDIDFAKFTAAASQITREASELQGRHWCGGVLSPSVLFSRLSTDFIYLKGRKMIMTTAIGASLCALSLMMLVSGCAMTEKKDAAAAQTMPINCATAAGDLRVLNNEKTSTAAKIGNGVSMIAPIGLVAGLVTGTEKTKYEVTTGEYNKALDTKIAQIKAECPGN
jgi:hypothetical protein